MSQTTTAGPKQTAGTVTGFKVSMISLIGMMIATLILHEVALVYMMVLVPTIVGILTGVVVGSLDMATGSEGISTTLVIAIALVADIIGIAVVLLFL
jgi:hypothetical protein